MIILGYQEELREIKRNFINLKRSLDSGINVYFLRPDEFIIEQETRNFLENYEEVTNSKIIFYHLNNIGKSYYKNIEKIFEVEYLDTWDTYYAFELFNKFLNSPVEYKLKDIKATFTALFHRCRRWRYPIIDLLAKHNLIKNNFISWHCIDNNYPFVYFTNDKISFKEPINQNKDIPFEWHIPPIETLEHSLWFVVNEDPYREPHISEKTWLPIFYKKPFIALGSKDFNKHLFKYGFKPYPYIDYSFDCLSSYEDRAQAFVTELVKINKLNKYETYLATIDTVEYNHKIFIDIIKNKKKNINNYLSNSDIKYFETIQKTQSAAYPLFRHLKNNIDGFPDNLTF